MLKVQLPMVGGGGIGSETMKKDKTTWIQKNNDIFLKHLKFQTQVCNAMSPGVVTGKVVLAGFTVDYFIRLYYTTNKKNVIGLM